MRGDTLAEAALQGSACTHVIALGKAAEALACGARRAIGGRLTGAFAALPRGYGTGELAGDERVELHYGGHPLADEASLEAGRALARFVSSLPDGAAVAVLVSGGASAAVEIPAPGVDLALLRRAGAWLQSAGLPIGAVNDVRARLSALKAGGLARLLGARPMAAWVLCDVPGEDLARVGGGPLGSWRSGPLPALPPWLTARLARPAEHPPPIRLRRLAGNAEAVGAVAERGARRWPELAGDAADCGVRLGALLARARPGLYVCGGETTVRLPADPGIGGRCQQLALAAAGALAGRTGCWLLAAGTDGWDGGRAVAGACIDGATLTRACNAGFDAGSALRRADAGSLLEASGDLVRTGPTGTNVNDLVIGLRR